MNGMALIPVMMLLGGGIWGVGWGRRVEAAEGRKD
jgi:hypothetical protein